MKNKKLVTITLVLFLSYCFTSIINAQIPNPSFEEWENVTYYDADGNEIVYEKPIGWSTNQEFGNERLQISTESLAGDYSLKLFFTGGNPSNNIPCYSTVSTSIDFNDPLEPNKSLFFYYKSVSDNSDGDVYLRFFFNFFQSGNLVDQMAWTNLVETPDFTLAEIPLTQDSDSIIIHINGGAADGPVDDCVNESTIWIDNLSIDDSTLSVSENLLSKEIYLYPNPFQDLLYVKNNSTATIKSISIYNSLGRKVWQGQSTKLITNLSHLSSGIYMSKITTEKGAIVKKLVKE